MTNSTSLSRIVELSHRLVRTEAGSKLYGKPIGSTIIPDSSPAPSAPASKITSVTPPKAPSQDKKVEDSVEKKGAVTLERVKSLQILAQAAVRTGNTDQIKKLTAQFHEAVAAYAKDKPVSQVIKDLKKPITTKKN